MNCTDANSAAASAFVDELARAGVRHACVTPGSRSTPLALAIARQHGLRAWTHIDERSSGFFALGIAKATGAPAAVLTTSGTAAANLLPAVVEAFHARVPLVILTADRPPELRACGATQTIDQIKLYGSHVKWSVEVGPPEAAGLRYFRSLACQAAGAARAGAPGPVHLNFPFREPLVPVETSDGKPPPGTEADDLSGGRASGQPYTEIRSGTAAPPEDAARELAGFLSQRPRGLIACGPDDRGANLAPKIERLASLLQYPILAEPTSQVRAGASHCGLMIGAYDAILHSEETAKRLAPEVMIRFGPMPISKSLGAYLERHPFCRQIVIDPFGIVNDPLRMASDLLRFDPIATCKTLVQHLDALGFPRRSREGSSWTDAWREAERSASRAIAEGLDRTVDLFEGKVFSELSRLLPDGTLLYVGNSMPIRDLETFWPAAGPAVRILCNRGANGIDGLVSSALGAAAASDAPLVLVVGDLSFYHDLNGLLAAKRHGVRAVIIVLDNDGGGIFSFLPQAGTRAVQADLFEEYFLTPHGLDFQGAVGMYGCAFMRVASWHDFRKSVGEALSAARTTVIDVPLDRARNVEHYRRIGADVGRALASP